MRKSFYPRQSVWSVVKLRIVHSAFCLLPSLCSASPSAPCNQNLDPERCVSVTGSGAMSYQMYHSETGSSLFSVESELRQAELAGDEVEHGDEMGGRAVAARFAFGRAEDAVQSLHERVGQSPLPVRQYPGQMFLHQVGHLSH